MVESCVVATRREGSPSDRALPSNTPEQEVRTWLEWSSSKLLAMQISSPLPRGYRVAWPEYRVDWQDDEKLRPPKVSSYEIALMDELLLLPNYIVDVTTRRVVVARSLVTPVSNRNVYSWPKIALMLHSNRKRAAWLYLKGLREIARALPADKASVLRKSFASLAT